MFSLKICYVLITHYHVIAIVLFSCAFVVQECCNKNVLTFRSFAEIVANRSIILILNKTVADRKVSIYLKKNEQKDN